MEYPNLIMLPLFGGVYEKRVLQNMYMVKNNELNELLKNYRLTN
jgi:hypothetical protein